MKALFLSYCVARAFPVPPLHAIVFHHCCCPWDIKVAFHLAGLE